MLKSEFSGFGPGSMNRRQRRTNREIEASAPEPLVRRFMPELDVLRGIAVLGVLFFHGFRAEYGGLPFTGARRTFLMATQPGASE